MSKLRIEVTRVECALPLTKRQWKRLEKLNNTFMDDGKIFHKLSHLGVYLNTIEYSGHFGQCLYFTANVGSDLMKIQEMILVCIETTPLR